tara:strand:+ start:1594 stop:1971 length:378 start_codon:yes stop_codon:yes gene_type:complete
MNNLSNTQTFLDAQTYINGYVSMMRNMYLLSTIGFTFLTISLNVNKNKLFFRIISLIMIIYSMTYGINSIYDFNEYINYLKISNLIDSDKNFLFKEVRRRRNISILYLLILVVMILFILFKLKFD